MSTCRQSKRRMLSKDEEWQERFLPRPLQQTGRSLDDKENQVQSQQQHVKLHQQFGEQQQRLQYSTWEHNQEASLCKGLQQDKEQAARADRAAEGSGAALNRRSSQLSSTAAPLNSIPAAVKEAGAEMLPPRILGAGDPFLPKVSDAVRRHGVLRGQAADPRHCNLPVWGAVPAEAPLPRSSSLAVPLEGRVARTPVHDNCSSQTTMQVGTSVPDLAVALPM